MITLRTPSRVYRRKTSKAALRLVAWVARRKEILTINKGDV